MREKYDQVLNENKLPPLNSAASWQAGGWRVAGGQTGGRRSVPRARRTYYRYTLSVLLSTYKSYAHQQSYSLHPPIVPATTSFRNLTKPVLACT